jgi:putative transposase
MSKSTPTFVYTMPLKVEPWEADILMKRFDMARMIYNAVLGEFLKRLKKMRDSELYKSAALEKDKTLKREIYRKAEKLSLFSEYDAHAYATKIKNSCYFKEHTDGHTPQTVAKRAWKSIEEYRFGKRGKPRFKGKNSLKSIEGKSDKSPLRFADGKVLWLGLKLDVIYDQKDQYGYEAYALNRRVKYVRLLKKFSGNKERFFVQLALEGEVFVKAHRQQPHP